MNCPFILTTIASFLAERLASIGYPQFPMRCLPPQYPSSPAVGRIPRDKAFRRSSENFRDPRSAAPRSIPPPLDRYGTEHTPIIPEWVLEPIRTAARRRISGKFSVTRRCKAKAPARPKRRSDAPDGRVPKAFAQRTASKILEAFCAQRIMRTLQYACEFFLVLENFLRRSATFGLGGWVLINFDVFTVS